MPYDRKHFFDTVRKDLFRGTLTQAQVDGMNYLLAIWERHFEEPNPRDGTKWLAYALATFFHETAERMEPIEEYGKGSGKSYGKPAGPHGQCYYGRGYVQLTWETNYKNGQQFLLDRYNVKCNIYPNASEALIHEVHCIKNLIKIEQRNDLRRVVNIYEGIRWNPHTDFHIQTFKP